MDAELSMKICLCLVFNVILLNSKTVNCEFK